MSYEQIMQLEEQLTTSLCERFHTDCVVGPAILIKGVFTLGALSNLDHDLSSHTSSSSFLGAGISLSSYLMEHLVRIDHL